MGTKRHVERLLAKREAKFIIRGTKTRIQKEAYIKGVMDGAYKENYRITHAGDNLKYEG